MQVSWQCPVSVQFHSGYLFEFIIVYLWACTPSYTQIISYVMDPYGSVTTPGSPDMTDCLEDSVGQIWDLDRVVSFMPWIRGRWFRIHHFFWFKLWVWSLFCSPLFGDWYRFLGGQFPSYTHHLRVNNEGTSKEHHFFHNLRILVSCLKSTKAFRQD